MVWTASPGISRQGCNPLLPDHSLKLGALLARKTVVKPSFLRLRSQRWGSPSFHARFGSCNRALHHRPATAGLVEVQIAATVATASYRNFSIATRLGKAARTMTVDATRQRYLVFHQISFAYYYHSMT